MACRFLLRSVAIVLLGMSFVAHGASLAEIPPGLVNQLKSMPPAQARALAQQYGIDLQAIVNEEAPRGAIPGQLGEAIVPINLPGEGSGAELGGLEAGAQASVDISQQKADASAGDVIEPLDPAQRFGLGFFSAEVSTFAPLDNSPVPQDYRLGPGDELKLYLLGQESGEFVLAVDRSGAVAVPELGLVTVAGMSFEAAADLLRQRIAAERIGVQALVTMGRLRAINVMLAGEVRVPGARSLSALSRVSHALFASGGLSPIGSLRNIQIKRGGEIVGRFDVYDLLLSGDARGDVQLRDGDVVFVPPLSRLAGVDGAVRRPGVFEVSGNETLGDLLSMAGGPTARGRLDGILLERERADGSPRIMQLSESELSLRKIEAGDRLRVQVASQRFSNRVVLKGAVQRPGIYGHFDGMRISDLLKDPDVDVVDNTDLGYALVVSTDRVDGKIRVRQFSPSKVFREEGSASDYELLPRDTLLIFSRPGSAEALRDEARSAGRPDSMEPNEQNIDEEAEARESSRAVLLAPVLAQLSRQATPTAPVAAVWVEGAVQAPGRYPLGVDYSVADLINAAGGFRGDAYQRAIEVQRVALNREDIAEVRTLSASVEGDGLASLKLQSRDRVSVRAIPNWEPDETVVLDGEFRFPGTYALLPGETLGELIDRVGGVSAQAFPYGAVYTAETAAQTERAETERFANDIRRSYAAMALTQQDQRASFQELEQSIQSILEREALGRIAIDLPRILAGDVGADIVLGDGDRIFLPRRNDTVTVLGEVFRPGSFRYEAGQSMNDYLALGAGATARANEKGIYLVRANGRVDRLERGLFQFGLNDSAVRPGDTIVVPVNASYRDPLDFWTSITQVAYQTGVGIAGLLAAMRN